MNDTTYNGWTNYPTWAAHIWLTNEATPGPMSADEIRDWLENTAEEATPEASLLNDLLTYAIGEINFREISEALTEAANSG